MKCPTLLVTGAEDKICCPKTAEEAARELAAAGTSCKIPKCGHAPQIEKHWLDQPTGRTLPQFADDRPPIRPGPNCILAKPTRVTPQ